MGEVARRRRDGEGRRNRSGCNAHKETRVQIVAALLPEEGVSEADGWCPRRNRNNCNQNETTRVQNSNMCLNLKFVLYNGVSHKGGGAPGGRALQRCSASLQHPDKPKFITEPISNKLIFLRRRPFDKLRVAVRF